MNNKPKYTALTPEEQRIWRMGYDKHDSELRPEPTAGDVEGDLLWAANIIAQITPEWDRLIASRTMEKVEGAHQELDAWSNIKYIIADALSAARGDAARKAHKAGWESAMYDAHVNYGADDGAPAPELTDANVAAILEGVKA